MKYFYVICPVGTDKAFSAKKPILQRLGREHGFTPFFPLERRRRFSVEKAISDIRGSDFVLADISFERPSCYFELGMALATRKTVYLISVAGTRIYQEADKSAELILFYTDLNEYGDAISHIMMRRSEDCRPPRKRPINRIA